MADGRCREEEDHALVWMQERPERTRKYPEKLLKLEDDEKIKAASASDRHRSNVREP
jgi:hypothetical protein